MQITQKNFDLLVENLNHRVTRIEVSVKWLTRLMGYMAVLLTGVAVKSIL